LPKKKKFNKAIKLALFELGKTKDKELIADLSLKLGQIYDQYALSRKHPKERVKELQKQAIAHFRKALKLRKAAALAGIGTVYHHQHKLKKALEYYKKAQKEDPGQPLMSHVRLGNVYRRMGEKENDDKYFKKAENYYQKSLALAQKPSEKLVPFANLAFLYAHDASKPQKAIKCAEAALKIIKQIKENERNCVLTEMEKEMAGIVKEYKI